MNTTVVLDPTKPNAQTPVRIHRVWARFNNANDALFVWGGGGGLGSGSINNLNSTGTGPGSGFLNNAFGGDLPPSTNVGISNSDTYFTIGVTLQNQIPTGQSISLLTIPGTPGGLSGTQIALSPQGGGVTTTPTNGAGAPNPISLAGFTGDGDTALRVLLIQLVVPIGQQVSGNIGITYNNASLAGATTTVQNQSFCSMTIPAPSGLINASDGTFCNQVQVAWNNVTGATGYQIYRDNVFLANDPNGASPYSDTSAVPGQVYAYQVAATNACGPSDFSNSDTGFRAAPVSIGTSPNPQSVCVGGPVTFCVNATGMPLNYQWRRNTVEISGANANCYTIPSASLLDAGNYDVIVSNACGAQTSAQALLTVNVCQPYRCVDDSAPAGGNGLDWCTAYNNLQTALAAAAAPNSQITELRIAQGTYRPAGFNGDRNLCFNLVNGVMLNGGWAGCGSPNPNLHDPTLFQTILSGDLNGNDGPAGTFTNSGENSYHVVCAGTNIQLGAGLSGITIRAGNANGPDLSPTNHGGGIASLGSPTILNCRIFHNQAGLAGGAGMSIQTGDPVILNTVFLGNVGGNGAAVNVHGDTANILSVAPIFDNCRFLGNHATVSAGALASDHSAPTLRNCLISGNSAQAGPGGVANNGSPTMINCTVIGNNTSLAASSGGLASGSPGNPALNNCIFWGNRIAGVANTQNAQIRLVSGSLAINYSCVQALSGSLGGVGNIGTDPRFNDPDGPDNLLGTFDDDAHLHSGSTCVDAGNSGVVPESMMGDLYGNARIADDAGTPNTGIAGPPPAFAPPGAVVDMGVHEFQFTTLVCDVTGNGQVNVDDLLAVITGWGVCPPVPASCPADVTHNGVVNVDDLLCVISNWAP